MHELFEILAAMNSKLAELKLLFSELGSEGDKLHVAAAELEKRIALMERCAKDALAPANDR